MTGFDDISDIDQLFNDPTFQAELEKACKSAFKRFSSPPYDTWEELMSEVFILLRKSEKFFLRYREITNETGYLYRIALNHLISRYRLQPLAADYPEQEPFIQELLKESIALLKPDEQAVIEWWMDRKSFAALARESKVTRATISKRFANAMKKIKRHLVRRGYLLRRT